MISGMSRRQARPADHLSPTPPDQAYRLLPLQDFHFMRSSFSGNMMKFFPVRYFHLEISRSYFRRPISIWKLVEIIFCY
jgi:hypothetical protein